MADDPYATPRTYAEGASALVPDGRFVPEGRGVPPGRGWQWIADAWAFTGLQRGTFIGVLLLLLLIAVVLGLVPLLGAIASSLLTPVFVGGFLLGCDAVRRGERLEVGHLFAGFQTHASKLIGLGALSLAVIVAMTVVLVAIFGTTVGSMFLGEQPSPEQLEAGLAASMLAVLAMLALTIPWYMAVWFAVPLIVFERSDVVPALRTSFFACLKNIVPFLVYGIAIFVLGIAASIPFMLGWLLLGPVMMVSIYLSYRDVFYAA
jgi:hypothetical protein